MIEVVIARLGIEPSTQNYVVVLQEKGGSRLLPIWIGKPEAESIVTQMHNMKPSRPLTHDLGKAIVLALGAVLRRVQITRVDKRVYYGELHLEQHGKLIAVDSRPSDAIALAIRLDAPIFAAESLLTSPEDMEEEFVDGEGEGEGETLGGTSPARDAFELTADQLKAYLEHLRPEDFGKFNL